ncbi:hypothetical protein RFI_04592, partial [Reticulomyxa filosa]
MVVGSFCVGEKDGQEMLVSHIGKSSLRISCSAKCPTEEANHGKEKEEMTNTERILHSKSKIMTVGQMVMVSELGENSKEFGGDTKKTSLEMKEEGKKPVLKRHQEHDQAGLETHDLVLKQIAYIKTRNVERTLQKYEPRLLKWRDDVYRRALDSGVTEQSPQNLRLAVIQTVVQWYFLNTFVFKLHEKRRIMPI